MGKKKSHFYRSAISNLSDIFRKEIVFLSIKVFVSML